MPHKQAVFSPLRLLAMLTCVASLVVASLPAAGSEAVLHSFNISQLGSTPETKLVADAYGNLYGTTSSGGAYRGGIVFELSPNSKGGGYTQTVIWNFGGSGQFDPGQLIFDSLGNLYGTASTNEGGAVFKLVPGVGGAWTMNTIFSFTGDAGPEGTLNFDSAGNLYGVNSAGNGAVYELSPNAQGQWIETTLYSFTGLGDGGSPNSGLAFDAAGNIFVTTWYGGDPDCNEWYRNASCGVVFKLTNNGGGTWTESTLLVFDITNGAYPLGGLVFDSTGNFYGATEGGPGNNEYCFPGCGTVYRMSPNSDGSWTQTLLYTFAGGPDAADPNGDLVLDGQGNLYGTSYYGGLTNCGVTGCGTVFEISPSSGAFWNEKVIYRFSKGSGGFYPQAPHRRAATAVMRGTHPAELCLKSPRVAMEPGRRALYTRPRGTKLLSA